VADGRSHDATFCAPATRTWRPWTSIPASAAHSHRHGERRGFVRTSRAYLEIQRPERLRFTWASAATRVDDSEVTVTFEASDGGTRVTLVHVGLPDATAADRHEAGCKAF
jgi:uncharacterized protein YndB with AHSA1/START domain